MVRRRCPYQSDLSEPNGNLPMSWEWVSLSIWLEWTLWESPYGRVKLNPINLTWNNPMGMVLWLIESVPINLTWLISMRKSLSKWSDSMRFEWIEVNRVKWGEMSEWMEMTWNNPMRKSLWPVESVPMEVTWCEWKSMSLSKWMELMRNEWNEVNRVNRGEMSDLMDLTWNNPMGMVLWSSEGVPMEVTWVKVKINVPIKMNGIDEIWTRISE